MPDRFDFAFVQRENLGLRWFPVSQATVTFKVTGASDPLTLQRMRDAVSSDFKDTQKKVNDCIRSRAGQIRQLSLNARARREDARLVDAGNQQIRRLLDEFKKAADARLAAFEAQEKKKAAKLAAVASPGTSAVKWLITLAWTTYQGASAVKDMYEGESPVKILDGIKGFVDALKDVHALLVVARDQFSDEKTVRLRVKAALKKLQAQKGFTESDVAAVASLVSLYETKVLTIEKSAQRLSSAITQAIREMPSEGITRTARQEAEHALDEQLQALVRLSTTLKRVEKQLTRFKLNLGAAKQAARKEKPESWTQWLAAKGYELKDVAFDAWELNFAQAAKGLSEKVIDALVKKWSVPENVFAAV